MSNPRLGARLTVHSRELIVARRAEGRPVAQIAAEFGGSVRTVYQWLRRYCDHGWRGSRMEEALPRARRIGWGRRRWR